MTISAQRPGVPLPPGASPHPVVFDTPQQLKTVTAALNADHIHQASRTTPQNGCAGGAQIAIVITQTGNRRTKLGAYQCAGTTTGEIAGNLTGFLSKTGVSVP